VCDLRVPLSKLVFRGLSNFNSNTPGGPGRNGWTGGEKDGSENVIGESRCKAARGSNRYQVNRIEMIPL
jgi:hypothetical protein